MPIVCSRAFVLAFVLFHDNRFASALATTGLHLVGIAGVVERFAVLENMTGRHGMRWHLWLRMVWEEDVMQGTRALMKQKN